MMKKITTLLLFVLSFVILKAQAPQTNLVSFDAAKSKLEKALANTEHPKKSLKSATWMKLASAYIGAAENNFQAINPGVQKMQVSLTMGKEQATEQKELNGELYNVLVYKTVDVYLNQQGQVAFWVEKNKVTEDALNKALKALDKAAELDAKGKLTNKIKDQKLEIAAIARKIGANAYSSGEYKESGDNIKLYLNINDEQEVTPVDTIMNYFAGIALKRAGEKLEAIKYYQRAIDLDYTDRGNVFIEISKIQTELGNTDASIAILEQGFKTNPKNSGIMGLLINVYLETGKDPKDILVLIDAAKKEDPENASLNVVEGNLYEKLGDKENAVKAYTTAIEKDPKNIYSYYSLGSMHINIANEKINEANKLPISKVKEYDALIEEANGEFRNSLPYLEKAHEVAPEDKDVAEILKTIYFKFRMESDEMMQKWEKMKALLEQ